MSPAPPPTPLFKGSCRWGTQAAHTSARLTDWLPVGGSPDPLPEDFRKAVDLLDDRFIIKGTTGEQPNGRGAQGSHAPLGAAAHSPCRPWDLPASRIAWGHSLSSFSIPLSTYLSTSYWLCFSGEPWLIQNHPFQPSLNFIFILPTLLFWTQTLPHTMAERTEGGRERMSNHDTP